MIPAVSIIIVSFNTKNLTLACLRSIVDETKRCLYEIIVFDNNSQDGSAAVIREEFPQVKLIASNENLGFARANNVAARNAQGFRILFLNPDTVVIDDAIDKIMEFADEIPQARVWGGRATFPDGSVNATCWSDMTLWSVACRAAGFTWMFPKSKLFNPEAIHSWGPIDRVREVDIIVGCFLLIDRDLWWDLDGFSPDFFMYGDEVDLCVRARRLGARPHVTPYANIVHYGGGSEPSSEDKLIKVFKGRVTVMKKHWSPLAARLGIFIMVVTVGLRAIVSLVVKSPRRRGSGQDGKTDVWWGAFRRCQEWNTGWAIKSEE